MATATTPRNLIVNPFHTLRRSEYMPMSIVELAKKAAIDSFGRQEFSDIDAIRSAFDQAGDLDIFSGFTKQEIHVGFSNAADSTQGWTSDVVMPNFMPAVAGRLDSVTPMRLYVRGTAAEQSSFGFYGDLWQIARYAQRLVADEQDIVDGANVGLWSQVSSTLGAVARSTFPNLVYSLLLENPELADGTTIFHADRGNLGSAALDATSLDVAISAIANRTLTDDAGRPVHVSWRPRYLLCCPTIYPAALRLVRDLTTGDEPPIVVRPEPRLSASGLVDPRTDTLIAGTAGTWLLAAESSSIPTVLVGTRTGTRSPTVAVRTLDQGRWGRDFSILVDAGVQVIQPGGLYLSIPAA